MTITFFFVGTVIVSEEAVRYHSVIMGKSSLFHYMEAFAGYSLISQRKTQLIRWEKAKDIYFVQYFF